MNLHGSHRHPNPRPRPCYPAFSRGCLGLADFSREPVCDNLRPFMSDPKSDRRSSPRTPVRVGVSVRSAPGVSATGHTRDLSTSGIFLYADSEILVGSELEMVLMLPNQFTNGEKRWVCCQASVVRVEPGGENGRFGVAASIRSIATLPEIPG
jgi:hypothetical protein